MLRLVEGGGEGDGAGSVGPRLLGEATGAWLRKVEGMRLRGVEHAFACARCEDSRWVAGEGGSVPCPECSALDRRDRLERLCAAAGIPRRYRTSGMKQYEDLYDEAFLAEAAFDAAARWAEEWKSGRPPERWLYVVGRGRAATALACAVAYDLLAGGVFGGEEVVAGGGVRYESAGDLLDGLRTSYAEQARPVEVRERAERPRLLIVDGLGGTPEEKAAGRFAEILRHRDGEMLPTVVVSRHAPRELAGGIGYEVSELLEDACDVLDLTGGRER